MRQRLLLNSFPAPKCETSVFLNSVDQNRCKDSFEM